MSDWNKVISEIDRGLRNELGLSETIEPVPGLYIRRSYWNSNPSFPVTQAFSRNAQSIAQLCAHFAGLGLKAWLDDDDSYVLADYYIVSILNPADAGPTLQPPQ